MMDPKALRCLRNSLLQDRARYRACRTRMAEADGKLIVALRDWQAEADPTYRADARKYARRLARESRKHRKHLSGIAASVRFTEEQYREAQSMMLEAA